MTGTPAAITEERLAAILTAVNAYETTHLIDPAADVWGDVILWLDEYDDQATLTADPGWQSDVAVLADGTTITRDTTAREWRAVRKEGNDGR